MKRIFTLGAIGYPLLELMYRGRTHYAMAIAGGTSALLADAIRKRPGSLAKKAMLTAAGITAIELACGAVWNRDYQVWDYRNIPLNWKGQICLPYSLLWCGLSAGLIRLLDLLDQHKQPDSL